MDFFSFSFEVWLLSFQMFSLQAKMPVAAPSIPFRMMTHTQEHKCDGCGVVWRVWDSLFLNKARQCGKTASMQVCVCV